MKRVESDRGEAEEHVLLEDKKQISQQGAALENGQGEGFTDEFAQRFGFGGNHRNQFT